MAFSEIEMPVEIMAGLPFAGTVIDDAHAAPDWALTLYLRGPAAIDIAAASDGDAHQFRQTAAETAAWTPGNYWWAIRASNGAGDVVEIERGTLAVAPDMLAADNYDGRSDAEKALEAIEAVLSKRATLDQERYRINNRELYRTPIADLLKLRAHYVALVRRERGRSGWGRAIPVRFS